MSLDMSWMYEFPEALNLCCGRDKITGAWNVDINPEHEPDQVMDILEPFPFPDKTFKQVFFFHSIEHIIDVHHERILKEVHRVLQPDGELILSYPEFKSCAQRYIDNHHGNRAFYKKAIYGRQENQWDFHVALMDSMELNVLLPELGFGNLKFYPEPAQECNTVCIAQRVRDLQNYEDLINREVLQCSKIA